MCTNTSLCHAIRGALDEKKAQNIYKNIGSKYVLMERCNKALTKRIQKQQLCLKASQKTELCALLELSAVNSAGKTK